MEEESMRKMVMMRKMKVIEDLNNEKDERKWQSMVLEMKIEEIALVYMDKKKFHDLRCIERIEEVRA
ncbi:hypothetical protein Tco_0010123 [Tanacetum coccineum]